MPPTPTVLVEQSVNICELAMDIPTLFDLGSFLIAHVLPVIFLLGVIIFVLCSKNKRASFKKIITNRFIILVVVVYIFFFPRTYIQLREDYEVKKKCECLGIKSEVFGGNQYCAMRQECLGIPYACKIAEDRCHVEHAGEVTIHDIRVTDLNPFTETVAQDLVKESNIPVEVLSIKEELREMTEPPSKFVTITYKVSNEYKENFMNSIRNFPIDRGQLSNDERKICKKTNL